MGEGDPRRVGAWFTRSVLAVLGIRVAVAASDHCPSIAKRVLSSQDPPGTSPPKRVGGAQRLV
jgi:hypothetical protein